MSSIPDQELHRVESVESFQGINPGYFTPSFLVPSPAAYEGRRGSVASSQSSFSYASSYSSAISEMPRTPPPHRDAQMDDMAWTQGPPSFETLHIDNGADTPFGGCHQKALLPFKQGTIEDNQLFQDAEWVSMHPTHGLPYSFSSQHEGILPAGSEFGSTLNAWDAWKTTHLATSSEPLSWSTPSTSFAYPSTPANSVGMETLSFDHGQFTNGVNAPRDMASGMPCSWSISTDAPYSEIPSPTIMPSEAVLEGDDPSYIHVHSDGFESSFGSYDSCSSPTPLSPMEVCPKMESSQSVKQEEDSDEYEDRRSRIRESSTGRKGVKKLALSAAGAKRKSRRTRTRSNLVRIQNADVDVYLQNGLQREASGKWRGSGDRNERFLCRFPKDNGSMCGRSFLRQEHLKRHERTHAPPSTTDPKCHIHPCTKQFNRNDNCLAHYKTHLQLEEGKKGRNDRYPLRDLIRMISESDLSAEEKKKITDTLNNHWAAEVEGKRRAKREPKMRFGRE